MYVSGGRHYLWRHSLSAVRSLMTRMCPHVLVWLWEWEGLQSSLSARFQSQHTRCVLVGHDQLVGLLAPCLSAASCYPSSQSLLLTVAHKAPGNSPCCLFTFTIHDSSPLSLSLVTLVFFTS